MPIYDEFGLEFGFLSYEVTLPINRLLLFVFVHTHNEILEKLYLFSLIFFLYVFSFSSKRVFMVYVKF